MHYTEAPTLQRASWVAHRLGKHIQQVYEMARTGELPVVRFGRSMRFDPADVEQFIASRKRSS